MWILKAIVGLGHFDRRGENWARLMTHRQVFDSLTPGLVQEFNHYSQESSRIILDICCKWDFDNHCPLPAGVKRSVADGKLFLAKMGFMGSIPSL
jgi:hypothetical protein